jgi:hypothetical protein
VYCEYQFYLDNERYKTSKIIGKNERPVFDYKYQHTVDYCSETFIEYLLKDSVYIYIIFIIIIDLF